MIPPATLKPSFAYLATGILCAAAMTVHFRLWEVDTAVPLQYTSRGDAFFNYMVIKTVIEHGWWYRNPSLGAPEAMELYDFPMTNELNLRATKALGLIDPDPFRVVNLFYLATFVLNAWAALFAFRRCGISVPLAVGGALSFSFLPYHFYRGQVHLFLSAYHAVPLVALVALRIAEDVPVFFDRNGAGELRLCPRGESVTAIMACVALAGSDVYYTFFGAFITLAAALVALLRNGSRRAALDAVLVTALTSIMVLVSVAPCLFHQRAEGPNPAPTNFSYMEAEAYGLRISNLIKPSPGDWIFSVVNPGYRERPMVENRYSYLGVPGVVGFVALLIALMTSRPFAGRLTPLGSLCRLNIASVLLGTSGGFGLMFARLVLPQIRGYNRISVVIAFYSLLTLLLIFEHLLTRLPAGLSPRVVRGGLVAFLLTSALVAQVPSTARPSHASLRSSFAADREFVRAVDAALPTGAMVFQLPYLSMPEEGYKPHKMRAYDHLRGYLHSRHLRWSYGAIQGRALAKWQAEVASLPPDAMLTELASAGFSGLYIDRYGYRDGAARLIDQLSSTLTSPPIESRNRRFIFFDIRSGQGRHREPSVSRNRQAGSGDFTSRSNPATH